MAWTDFMKYFGQVQIVKYYDNFQLSYEPHKGDWGAHIVHVQADGIHNFSLSQVGDRMFPRNSDYRLSPCRMFLLKLTTDLDDLKMPENVRYIRGVTKTRIGERDCHLETEIEAGTYLLFTEVDWKQAGDMVERNYTVTCNSEVPVLFTNSTE